MEIKGSVALTTGANRGFGRVPTLLANARREAAGS